MCMFVRLGSVCSFTVAVRLTMGWIDEFTSAKTVFVFHASFL
jgi:hypothetical protein